MHRLSHRAFATLALLAVACGTAQAFVSPEETRVQACAFASFNQFGELGTCVDRPGLPGHAGVSVSHSEVSGPFPDPTPGSAKVAQASSSTQAQFGVLRINDLAGGIAIKSATQPLLGASATSRASFSDVLTFRAPASMSTADFLSTMVTVDVNFSAATTSGATVTLMAFGRQGDSFNSNFFPGSGNILAVADSLGEHRDLFPDRALHLALNNPRGDRFVSFAITLALFGDARFSSSAEATAWMGGISFAHSAASGALALSGDFMTAAQALPTISVSSASGEVALDPATGQFRYLAAPAVPEPASYGLMALGLALVAWRRRAARAAGAAA